MSGAAVVYDDTFLLHDFPGHPETAARLRAITDKLAGDPALRGLPASPAPDADLDLLRSVHTDRHILGVERAARSGGGWLDGDTYCTPRSYDVAVRAAGAAMRVTEMVMTGEARSAFALVRPPGHHATPDHAMGFCLFNNAAVAARTAQRVHGAERVAIVDIDVHHGNGTQDVFWADPRVLYISLHQFPLYPGTGRPEETGEGPGEGANLNVALPPGTAGDAYRAAVAEVVVPAAERFGPTWVLVSAGFDGHRADPLANMALSAGDYADLAGPVLALAPPGRRLAFLEGGYDLDALAASAGACVASMAGVDYRPEAPTSGGVGREAVERAARLVGLGGGSGRRRDQSME
jgi:acetoin utilization deacetylase AcuC-like enzyme